jgi:hypothetical protein
MAAESFEVTVEGVVNSINFVPGRSDGLVDVCLDGNDRFYQLALRYKDSEITVDGCSETSFDHLACWLFNNRCRVKLYPRADRYELSTKAEFTGLYKGDR